MSDRCWRLPPWTVRQTVSAADIGQTWPWGLKFAGIDKLHVHTKGAGVKVAVLDTGVDATHPDLVHAITDRKNFAQSAWGTDDRQGHGTHTAGTLAAADNGIGVVGLVPEAELLVGKVLGDDGSGSMQAVSQGIRWAVESGAQVISLSLGSADDDSEVRKALEYAAGHGVLVACAAGNSGRLIDPATGQDVNTVDFPGKWTSLCSCVGAHDDKGKLADFSSRGPEVDVLAPGVHVPSCWPGNKYAYLDGTSMATPFVAGTIALLIAYRKKHGLPAIKTQAELETELFKTAVPIGNGGPPFGSGHGLLNPKGLFDAVVDKPATGLPPATLPEVINLPLGMLNGVLGYNWELQGKRA